MEQLTAENSVLKEKIRELEEKLLIEKQRWSHEKAHLQEEMEKVSAKLQRQKDFSHFPLLKLPDDVFLEIVAKLQKRKHRRYLMQTCRTFRRLLYGKRGKDVDCRILAEVHCSFFVHDDPITVLIKVTRPEANGINKPFCEKAMLLAPNEAGYVRPSDGPARYAPFLTGLTDEQNDNIREMANIYETDQVVIELWARQLANSIDASRASAFIEEVTNHFKTFLHYKFLRFPVGLEESLRQLWRCIENCPRRISLEVSGLGGEHSHDPLVLSGSRRAREILERNQQICEEVLTEEAGRRGFPVIFEESGKDEGRRFRLDVNEDKKSLIICRPPNH